MEAARTSETLVNFYQTTRRYNPKDSHLCTHHHENLKSHIINTKYEISKNLPDLNIYERERNDVFGRYWKETKHKSTNVRVMMYGAQFSLSTLYTFKLHRAEFSLRLVFQLFYSTLCSIK
jgi:hypothetical protein